MVNSRPKELGVKRVTVCFAWLPGDATSLQCCTCSPNDSPRKPVIAAGTQSSHSSTRASRSVSVRTIRNYRPRVHGSNGDGSTVKHDCCTPGQFNVAQGTVLQGPEGGGRRDRRGERESQIRERKCKETGDKSSIIHLLGMVSLRTESRNGSGRGRGGT